MAHSYEEIYDTELDCWCFGLQRIGRQIENPIFYKVVQEFAPTLRESIENHYACDLIATAKRLTAAARCKIPQQEAVFYMLSYLPSPADLTESQKAVLQEIVGTVEKTYEGARQRLEKRWNASTSENSGSSTKSYRTLACPPSKSA